MSAQGRKVGSFFLALCMAFCLFFGIVVFSVGVNADDESIISGYSFELFPGFSLPASVERISDTVYLVQDYSNGQFLSKTGQFIQFDLPDDISVVDAWDGIGQRFDCQLGYDPVSKQFSMQAALNGAALQYRSWAGCYYFELSDGRIVTLIFDATCHMSQIGVPNTIELFNEEANEELGGEYTISGLYAAAQQGLGFSTVVRAALDSEQASLLSFVISGGDGERNQPDYYQIKPGVKQTWTQSFYNTVFLDGREYCTFSCATDLNNARSLPFTLHEGINVVEIVMNCTGFEPSSANGYTWFNDTPYTKSYLGAVYIIDFRGEPATIPQSGNDASIQEGSVAAFISGATNDFFSEREVIYKNGTFTFSVPSSFAEAPQDATDSCAKGVVITASAFDPRAKVEIIETEGQNLLAGNHVGSCFGINIPNLPADHTFTIRVTSADSTATKDYPVTVVFADSDTTLDELSVSGAELDDPFDESIHSYYLSFNAGKDSAEISYSVSGGQKAFMDGEAVDGQVTVDSSQPLHTLTVNAEDGITTSSYYFITVLPDGSIPYFTITDETKAQAAKLLEGYRSLVSEVEYFGDVWPVFMAKAAAEDIVDWNEKYVYNLEKNNPNRQATDPARAILTAILLGEDPYHFDADGDGTSRDFVAELQGWSSGGAWANNIWYNMAAKAVGLEPRFENALKANATDMYYDLDMRSWVIASLNHCFGLEKKDMVPFIESLHNVQSTYENGLYTTEKYMGLWRGANGYGYDGNTYTIGTVLSAIASVGADPDVLFAYSANGQGYDPLDQIESVIWDEETGLFTDYTGDSTYPKDMIIGLGDILQGSNLWDRLTLTEEKYAALLEKAAEAGVDAADMPAYGEAGHGEAYYSLYAAVADKLEESGDTSMRPKVIWGLPDEIFVEHVEALPGEDEEGFVEYVGSLIEEYEGLNDIDKNIIPYLESSKSEIIAAYQAAVAAALNQQDETGDTADFYTRVMALPDALIITEESRDEVDALRYLYDHMSDEQQALVDWAGKSVLLKLMAAEAVLGTPEDQEPETMTISFTLLGAPNDGEEGVVNTLMDENLELWYETEQTFNAESLTAEQVFRVIMGEAGIAWRGNSQNQYGSLYVSGIQSPLTGEWMEEFTTTNNSGWMYTVNGTHPSVGLSNWTLYDGDEFVMHFTDDYTKEEDAAQYADQESGGSAGGSKEPDEISDTIVLEAEETEDGAAAALDGETAENWLAATEDDSELTLRVDGEEDKTALTLEAEAVAALAEADTEVRVELGDTALLLDAETMDELAKTGEDVAITVETGEDGETKLSLTAGGKALDAVLPVELPAAENAQVLAILRKGGQQEIVRKSVVSGGKVYAEIPAGVKVKAVENKKTFEDVKDGDWFAAAVDFAASHELFQGVGDGLFAPKSQMTRAMLVTVLYRLSDEPAAAGGTSFDDVVPGSWYADAVAWASAEGIVLGNGEGFAPNDNITREQIATILYRYMKYLGEDVSAKGDVSTFSDGGEVSAWAKDAMAWAVKVGLFQGNADGTLNPGGEATRAEVATLMERLVKLLVLK